MLNRKVSLIAGLLVTALLASNCVAADVAVDVGHSIKHPGAVSISGANELDLNIALAENVANNLQAKSISTHLIGDDGKMDVLTDRTLAAKDDALFLSIHHDSILKSWMPRVHEFSGFSVFVSRKNKQVDRSLACASKIGAALINAGFKPSRYHALPIEGQNRPFADEANGVHYFDDLIVLKTAKQPAILVEAGVIVNDEDELRVTSPVGRQRVAIAIASGVVACDKLIVTSLAK
jgi:N-acetylmuramoyl-L-alanine amidase